MYVHVESFFFLFFSFFFFFFLVVVFVVWFVERNVGRVTTHS